jgi:N-acetylmuramoyl-L-alanine amidase
MVGLTRIAVLGALGSLAGCGSAAKRAPPVTISVAAQAASTPSVATHAPPPRPRRHASAARGSHPPPGRAGVLRRAVIVIDPGHNGGDAAHPDLINRLVPAGGFRKACDTTGTATPSGYTEASFNFDVALRIRAILQSEGARVVLTRSSNDGVGPCVNERAAVGNRAHADAAISIHADSFLAHGHGFHVIEPRLLPGYTDAIVAPSARLGQVLRDRMARDSGLTPSNYLGHDGIDVRGDLGGLNLSHVPKVFLENGNMQNPHDSALQTDPSWRERLARVVAEALRVYLTGSNSGAP